MSVQGGRAFPEQRMLPFVVGVLLILYVCVALVLTGHTKVLWGAGVVNRHVARSVLYVRRAERRAVGAPHLN